MPIELLKRPVIVMSALTVISSFPEGKCQAPLSGASVGENRRLEIYVDAAAEGDGRGSAEAPFKSLTDAQARARIAARSTPVTVRVRSGIYRLKVPLVITEADSGTKIAPVIYQAEGEVVLSGATRIHADWQKHTGKIFRANVPAHMDIDQLWLGEHAQWMARYPNRSSNKSHRIWDAWPQSHSATAPVGGDALASARTASWNNPAGAFVHAMHPQLWGSVHFQVTGPAKKGALPMKGGTQHNRGSSMHPVYRYVENVFEELDAPGEWFHDRATHTLYCYPSDGIDLQTVPVLAGSSRQLIEFRGSADNPVRFVTFRGFTFQHTNRGFMETAEPILRSDWTIHRGAALFANGAEDISIEDCRFFDLGGNAVFLSGYNRRIRLERCVFDRIGASGIAFVGESRAVRDTRTAVDDKTDFIALDRAKGPIGSHFPADCLVDNCLIRRTGRIEKQTAGIQIALAARVTIRRSTIHDVPRAGINIGTGAWGGHLIEECDVFDTVQETGDHGAFNAWGRDRFVSV